MNTLNMTILISAIIITCIFFYNTIITKKWRNLAENEEESWRFLFLYFNKEDKRIFLPKRTGLGFTLNFAKPLSYVFLLAMFSIVEAIIIYF